MRCRRSTGTKVGWREGYGAARPKKNLSPFLSVLKFAVLSGSFRSETSGRAARAFFFFFARSHTNGFVNRYGIMQLWRQLVNGKLALGRVAFQAEGLVHESVTHFLI